MECRDGINIPTNLPEDPCGGERINTTCVIDSATFSELGLSENATQAQINQALYLAFINLKGITDNLQDQIDAL